MSFAFELGDGMTLWDPALRVGMYHVAAMEAHAQVLDMPPGFRRENNGTASVLLDQLRALVEALLNEFAESNHEIRRRQIEATLPECLVILRRAGLKITRPANSANELFDHADALEHAMTT